MPFKYNNKYYLIKANGKYYDIYNPFKTYTLTINPNPADATVALTATGYSQVGNAITVEKGTSVSWSVSKSGYVTQSGTQAVNSDEIKSITLSPSILYYCYRAQLGSGYLYYYTPTGIYPIVSGTTVYTKLDFTQATTSSELTYVWTSSDTLSATLYPSGDLYT